MYMHLRIETPNTWSKNLTELKEKNGQLKKIVSGNFNTLLQ